MPANVETMMYVREKPWHGLGTMVSEAPTSASALKFAGLDWNVRQEPVFNSHGGIIPGFKANVRDSDNSVLGVVGDRYKVVQNADAFRFTDDLIGGDVRYETAGSLRNGKQIWLLAKMPEQLIAGDKVEPYLCFTNAHDGSSGVKVCMTPIRVVCNNTLNVALDSAKRIWSMRHTENVHERLDEARDCLFRAQDYMDGLSRYADVAANTTLRDEEIRAIVMVSGENAGLECKTTYTLDLRQFKGVEFPTQYYAQCVHYLAVTGCDRWYLAVLVFGRGFYTYVLERDQAEIDALMGVERTFWDLVESDTPPAIDGTEASTAALQMIYPNSTPTTAAIFGRDMMLKEYFSLRKAKSKLDERITEIENTIKNDMGEAESGDCGIYHVSWKSQTRSTFQAKQFAQDHPTIDLTPYYKNTQLRPFKVTEQMKEAS